MTDDLIKRLDAADELEAQAKRIAEAEAYLGNLLTTILRDGGFTQRENGTDNAVYEATTRIAELEAEASELNTVFNVMYAADQSATAMWQKATGENRVWPDRTRLVLWLLEQLDIAEADLAAARACIRDLDAELFAEMLGRSTRARHAAVIAAARGEQTSPVKKCITCSSYQEMYDKCLYPRDGECLPTHQYWHHKSDVCPTCGKSGDPSCATVGYPDCGSGKKERTDG